MQQTSLKKEMLPGFILPLPHLRCFCIQKSAQVILTEALKAVGVVENNSA